MLNLAENLKDYADKKEMMEGFQKKFPEKRVEGNFNKTLERVSQ